MSRLGGLKVAYWERVLLSWLAPSTQERLMAFESERRVGKQFPEADSEHMVLEKEPIGVTTHRVDAGAETLHDIPWRRDLIKLLNDALATELVCVLRYKRHCFVADGLAMPAIAEEFLGYANEELIHADQLARRIVQLGGKPDFSPNSLVERSRAAYDDSLDLRAMVRADLIAERAVIDAYCRILTLIGDTDLTTRRLVEDILIDEMEHAEELRDLRTD
jgi:bacterioferritin